MSDPDLIEEPNEEEIRSRVHERWEIARPTPNCLTWNVDLKGDNFIRKAEEYGVFGEGRTVLEIGPGYGRLLEAAVRLEMPFKRYLGVDISEKNVQHLQEKFPDEAIRIVHGPIEFAQLGEPVDSVVSSATLKHLYPSFEAAFQNLEPQLAPGAVMVFDLIEKHVEGKLKYWEPDGRYTCRYTRSEIEALLERCSLELQGFDHVSHAPGPTRLLVIARKPG